MSGWVRVCPGSAKPDHSELTLHIGIGLATGTACRVDRIRLQKPTELESIPDRCRAVSTELNGQVSSVVQ